MNSTTSTDWLNKDINECQSFDEVSQYRIIQSTINKNSHDNYESVLTRIYREPTHFIYELLQNADNVRATKAKLILEKNRLIFIHNGKDEFTLQNVISITGVANSHYLEKAKAGGFGVGFKAVFAICERPEIYSRDYNFAIEKLSIPVKIDKQEIEDNYTTMFILPFSSQKYSNSEIHKRVEKELKSLDTTTIMFLFRLKNILVQAPKWDKRVSLSGTKKEDAILYTDPETQTKYLTFRKKISESHYCSIAYQLDSDDDVTPPDCKYVSSYFPTKLLSEVNLIIDAPFALATTRETLDYEDEKNQALLQEIKSLFKSSIKTLKGLKILTPYTISQMPLEDNPDNALAQTLYEGFKELMLSGAYIPTKVGRYVSARTALIASNSEIEKLVKKKNWVDTAYNLEYFKYELDIPVYYLEDMLDELTVKELKTKSDDWLYTFYSYLSNYCERNKYQYEWLLHKPIIKTRTNNFVSAKDNNNLANLFRKSNGVSDAHTIHTLFTTQSENVSDQTKHRMLDLLSYFGIQERSPKTTIEMDILKKWPQANVETTIKLFHQMADIYNKSNSTEKTEIINMLNDFSDKYYLFIAKDGNKTIRADAPIYENTEELHALLKNVPNTYFIDPRLWTERYEEKKTTNGEIRKICLGTNEFCRALGVTDQFFIKRFFAFDYHSKNNKFELNPKSRKKLRIDENNWKFWTSETYYIDDFETILSNINNRDKGKALIKLLSHIPHDQQFGILSQAPLRGYRSCGKSPISSDPFVKLNETKWCYDEKNKKVFPYQLAKEEFINLYQLSGKEPILSHLEFKDDARKDLKQEDKEILEFIDSCSEEELAELEIFRQRLLQERKSKETTEIVVPIDKIPDAIFVTEINTPADKTPTDTITGGKISKPTERTQTIRITTTKLPGLNKIIGDNNERTVMKALAKKFNVSETGDNYFVATTGEKVTLMGGSHKGYDIRIEKNGEIIKRIEVKSYEKGIVSISPDQWEYAKNYQKEFAIYRVKKVYGQPSEIYVIENPYQQFLDNKIELVPSRLKLVK